jgi:hypothetical protein
MSNYIHSSSWFIYPGMDNSHRANVEPKYTLQGTTD